MESIHLSEDRDAEEDLGALSDVSLGGFILCSQSSWFQEQRKKFRSCISYNLKEQELSCL